MSEPAADSQSSPTTPVETSQDAQVAPPKEAPTASDKASSEAKSHPPSDKAPLRAWPYPSAEEVDLVVQDPTFIITLPRVIGVVIIGALVSLWQKDPSFQNLVLQTWEVLNTQVGMVILGLNLLLIAFVYKKIYSRTTTYLVDFACFEPPEDLYVPKDRYIQVMRNAGFFTEELCQFQERLLPRTGLGEQTAFPQGIFESPPALNMKWARQEFDQVAKGAIDDLFAKTGVKPRDIGILIVNCSLFNPTPSMCARIINLYKMRSDIQSYNLSGMGCSASVIAVHLASDLLQNYPNTYALVFSTENITQNWYIGGEKNMLVQNTLFRVGGAAILLSNKSSVANKSKFALVDTYRTHMGAQDDAYQSVYQLEDDGGKKGVRLTQDLMKIAEKGLTLNLNYLGPVVLPYSEQLKFVVWMIKKRLGLTDKVFVPDFKKGIQHFCIHAGGRAIIDGLEKTLSLEERHVAPSRATLYRYGNTSSSSIWYELRYIERSGTLKAGDIIWQIALGSGFKCNSGVWRSLKTVKNRKAAVK